ncbi:MAG: ParB/RepB/Spo0J family partition protein [Oscillibacter sp.]|nr:ParB/RepB/Spo0J family partition protein [Oscillibacter sp.]
MYTPKSALYQSSRIHMLPIERISPNPRQPRRHFPEQPLRELADSIRQHGVLQPLSVQKTDGCYVLVAGERRLRAAGLAGLTHVPCILVKVTPQDSALLALVENLQRSDLHYLEEAAAISKLITTYGMSQEEAARRLGRSQPAVANKLRLLRLSPACGELLRQYELTERHARALLRLEDEQSRLAALKHIGEKQLTVAASEEYIEVQLQRKQQDARENKRLYIIKDVRLFLNSVDRGMETIRRAGVDARFDRRDSEEEITITIQIPKQRTAN